MGDVKYLGNGDAVLVLGDGPDRVTQAGDGSQQELAQLAFVRLGEIEHGEAEGFYDERPTYDEETATWAPPGVDQPQAGAGADQGDTGVNTPPGGGGYTENGDGTWTRDSDGARGTFGPQGFRAQEDASSGPPLGNQPPEATGTAAAQPNTPNQPAASSGWSQ